ncbi:MAG: hypothetical protein CO187_06740 [Zetaproteobacteria bacterium CG_4_9_14_3_um_filter_53_7]|nr:MAG: hypothetical protein CO187_06740 [Zetaproteobacteria bacterium CG_4_9_14_3_um_filter_53_7]
MFIRLSKCATMLLQTRRPKAEGSGRGVKAEGSGLLMNHHPDRIKSHWLDQKQKHPAGAGCFMTLDNNLKLLF